MARRPRAPIRYRSPLRGAGGHGQKVMAVILALGVALGLILSSAVRAQAPFLPMVDPLTGPRSPLAKNWIGSNPVPAGLPILVLAGHADSQNMAGAGTPGEAVGLFGAEPMEPGIRDELYWNLRTAERVVALGRQRGLAIRLYVPPERTIPADDDPRTNWSVGRQHVRRGGYALEIHHDAYGPDGVGSGLIPPLDRPLSRLDESLAEAFGAYPTTYRGGLGGPRRGLALLEIGKLERPLEPALRDPESREAALAAIAERVVQALERGVGAPVGGLTSSLGQSSAPSGLQRSSSAGSASQF